MHDAAAWTFWAEFFDDFFEAFFFAKDAKAKLARALEVTLMIATATQTVQFEVKIVGLCPIFQELCCETESFECFIVFHRKGLKFGLIILNK